MSKELDYIADLERENCLLGERCNQLLKDKGELTDKIADIKANCDLAIEGRDIKIDELEEKNSQMFNTIALQEQQIEKMKNECSGLLDKLYLSGLKEKQIALVEKMQDILGV